MSPDVPLAVKTKQAELTLDQLAEVQPGMARIMDEYGRRFWTMYYAAKAGNWELARYMHRNMLKLGATAATLRPKFAEAMREFEDRHMKALGESLEAKDFPRFDAEYRRAIAGSDEYHDRFKYGYIRFRLPDHPPEWLRMEPSSPPPTSKNSS